jgi:hypothetical protein
MPPTLSVARDLAKMSGILLDFNAWQSILRSITPQMDEAHGNARS